MNITEAQVREAAAAGAEVFFGAPDVASVVKRLDDLVILRVLLNGIAAGELMLASVAKNAPPKNEEMRGE